MLPPRDLRIMKFSKCGQWGLVCVGIVFIIFSSLFLALWNIMLSTIINHELVLTNTSITYKFWKEPPVPIYLLVYLFNWTNAEQVIESKWNLKPKVSECGPYVFSQHHVRVNLRWNNNNNTLTYQQKRIWKFIPSMSNGSLDDKITNVNPVTAVVAHSFENLPNFVQFAIDKLLVHFDEKLFITKSARELLFDGYEDPILQEIAKAAKLFGFDFNFDRMGWFYSRNNSASFEGTFTVYTGKDDITLLGMMNLWNGSPTTNAYTGACSFINGSSGELYPPIETDKINIFSADICSSLTLERNGTDTVNGVVGYRFIGTDYNFDNGSKYPEQACFVANENIPKGVRGVSKCKFGAPAFVSYPHFYLGDSIYVQSVMGLHPNETAHQIHAVFEPNTGIPLSGNLKLQINLFLNKIPGFRLFKDVKPLYVPVLWFEESSELPSNYSTILKIAQGVMHGGPYLLCVLVCVGLLSTIAGLYFLYSTRFRRVLPIYQEFENGDKTE